jgi:hypothetical protein
MLLPHWVFENVVVVSFQITFRVKMYQNDFFFIFLKIIFGISTSKRSKTYKKILIFCKKKLKFLRTRFAPRFQTNEDVQITIFSLYGKEIWAHNLRMKVTHV